MNETNNEPVRALAHRVALTLLGLFEVHDAPAELVDHTAEELETIFREHIGSRPAEGVQGRLALERLLDELEAGEPAEVTH